MRKQTIWTWTAWRWTQVEIWIGNLFNDLDLHWSRSSLIQIKWPEDMNTGYRSCLLYSPGCSLRRSYHIFHPAEREIRKQSFKQTCQRHLQAWTDFVSKVARAWCRTWSHPANPLVAGVWVRDCCMFIDHTRHRHTGYSGQRTLFNCLYLQQTHAVKTQNRP